MLADTIVEGLAEFISTEVQLIEFRNENETYTIGEFRYNPNL